MKKVKAVIAIVLVLLVLIMILQNTQAVETRLLFLTVTMPKALLIILALLVGIALGVTGLSLLESRSWSHKENKGEK